MTERITVSLDEGEASVIHAPGSGPSVVLIHGSGANARTWEPTVGAWAGFDVWCPSLPGRDGSTGPAAATVGEGAAWVASLVTKLELRRPIILGHSLGGAIALELGFARSIEFEALVIVASGARLRVSPLILEAAAKATPQSVVPVRMAFGPDTPEAVVAEYERRVADTPPAATLADWHACDRFDRLAQLHELDARVLVVHGDQDTLTPAKYQRKLEADIRGAKRVEVSGTGHMLPWEQPKALADAVRAFLTGYES